MFAENVPEHIRNSYVLPEPQEPESASESEPPSAITPQEQDNAIVLKKNDLPILLKALGKLPLEESYVLFTRLKAALVDSDCKGCRRKRAQ